MTRLRVAWLPDGKRLHLRQGAVDLILQAFGRPVEVGRAYNAGIERARGLAGELAEDLQHLRDGRAVQTNVGLRAAAACRAVPGALGPRTALTGALADEVLTAMAKAGQLDRAYVNNHGVVAFHLAEGQSISPAAMDWPEFSRYDATTVPIVSAARTRGLAAGGWDYHGYAFGCVDRIYTAAPSCAVAEAVLGAVTARMVLAGLETAPAGELDPYGVLETMQVYRAPLQAPAREDAAAIMAQGREAATTLFAAGTATLVLIQLNNEPFLVAPPQFSLKSMLSIDI